MSSTGRTRWPMSWMIAMAHPSDETISTRWLDNHNDLYAFEAPPTERVNFDGAKYSTRVTRPLRVTHGVRTARRRDETDPRRMASHLRGRGRIAERHSQTLDPHSPRHVRGDPRGDEPERNRPDARVPSRLRTDRAFVAGRHGARQRIPGGMRAPRVVGGDGLRSRTSSRDVRGEQSHRVPGGDLARVLHAGVSSDGPPPRSRRNSGGRTDERYPGLGQRAGWDVRVRGRHPRDPDGGCAWLARRSMNLVLGDRIRSSPQRQ